MGRISERIERFAEKYILKEANVLTQLGRKEGDDIRLALLEITRVDKLVKLWSKKLLGGILREIRKLLKNIEKCEKEINKIKEKEKDLFADYIRAYIAIYKILKVFLGKEEFEKAGFVSRLIRLWGGRTNLDSELNMIVNDIKRGEFEKSILDIDLEKRGKFVHIKVLGKTGVLMRLQHLSQERPGETSFRALVPEKGGVTEILIIIPEDFEKEVENELNRIRKEVIEEKLKHEEVREAGELLGVDVTAGVDRFNELLNKAIQYIKIFERREKELQALEISQEKIEKSIAALISELAHEKGGIIDDIDDITDLFGVFMDLFLILFMTRICKIIIDMRKAGIELTEENKDSLRKFLEQILIKEKEILTEERYLEKINRIAGRKGRDMDELVVLKKLNNYFKFSLGRLRECTQRLAAILKMPIYKAPEGAMRTLFGG